MDTKNNAVWHRISNQNEADEFMKSVYAFHDSCLKEIKYISGAYVKENLSMCPINTERALSIIVQRQFEENSMIELKFSGLIKLILSPDDENYTCEILDSELGFRDGLVWWTDGSIDDEEIYSSIKVCASSLEWRAINGYMGADEFYKSADKTVS